MITRERAEALVEQYGTIAEAARQLGVPRQTLSDLVNGRTTTLRKFKSADGETVLEWNRTPERKPGQLSLDEALAVINEAMANVKGVLGITPPDGPLDADLITVYPIVDHHLMMLSWAPETGNNWDLKIAEKVFKETAASVVAGAPNSETAVVLGLGDFFHADDNSSRTPMHGNQLDTEGRIAKALFLGVEMHVWMVQLALQKHKTVKVRILPGNHDPYISLGLAMALYNRFYHEPRVEVDLDPGVFWVLQWGLTMLFGHHGHQVPPEKAPGVMASFWAEMWGQTEYRYALFGHIHRSKKGPSGDEFYGAQWETFQTLTAKDAFAYGHGYSSKRSMTAITYHRETGEWGRVVRNIRKDAQ